MCPSKKEKSKKRYTDCEVKPEKDKKRLRYTLYREMAVYNVIGNYSFLCM